MLSGVHHPADVTLHGWVGAVSGLPLPGRLKDYTTNRNVYMGAFTALEQSLIVYTYQCIYQIVFFVTGFAPPLKGNTISLISPSRVGHLTLASTGRPSFTTG